MFLQLCGAGEEPELTSHQWSNCTGQDYHKATTTKYRETQILKVYYFSFPNAADHTCQGCLELAIFFKTGFYKVHITPAYWESSI